MRLLPLLVMAFATPTAAQDIVVTGDRRAHSLETLAGNTARLDADDLTLIDAQVPSEALNRLPGVAIHRNNGVENLPAIRSPVLTGGQSAGSFLVLEDGVPIRAPGFGNVNDLYEAPLDFADAVEVVRGPGSALYGSNAVHGLVNVITSVGIADRGACVRDAVSAEAGSFGRARLNVTTRRGVSLSHVTTCDEVIADVGASGWSVLGLDLRREDGWRNESGVDIQSGFAGFGTTLSGWDVDARLFVQNLNQETAAFVQGTNAYDDGALARANAAPEAFRDQRLIRARVNLSRRVGDWEFRATPYTRWIDAQLLLSFFPSRALEETSQRGVGAQTALYWDSGDNLSLIFGGDVDWTHGDVREVQARETQPNGYVQGLHYDYGVDMLTMAAYTQARWRFAPHWSATAGLRAERVRYDYDNAAPANDAGRFRRPEDREDEFNALTPKLGLVWAPREGSAFYVNLARGARPPQIVDLYSLQTLQTPGEQGVETIDSVELGWRGALGAARLEAALYHMDKRDTSFRNADGVTVNDGRTRHQGVELSADAPLGDRVDLSGWIGYARHTYRFADPSGRAGETIRAGNDIDSAPHWLWNARASWRVAEPVLLELEWAHTGRYFTNAENTRAYPGHDLFNLRGEWRANEALALFAVVRNLTNTDYAERADFAFGEDRYFPGEGRGVTIGVRATN